jgi:uncharacterized protein (TIGR03437 family)
MKSCLAALFLVVLEGVGTAHPHKTLAIVNAASDATVVAPNSVASAFGGGIGASTALALTLPLPTTLNGVSMKIADSAKVSQAISLFYVSPNQINFVVPDGTAAGTATVTIDNGDGNPASITVEVADVAPGLFTANSAGTGVAAAIGIRRIIATQTDTTVPVFQCNAHGCTSVPIDVGNGAQVFLELFGTGIRGRSSLANVTATLGSKNLPVLFAGPQGQFPGLDQVNVQLPDDLHGMGERDLVLTVDGQVANTVRVNIH